MEENSFSLSIEDHYLEMKDGTQLAMSIFFANQYSPQACVLVTTRYWRALELHHDDVKFQPYYPLAIALAKVGYRLAVVDARGSGASFGMRLAETDNEEVDDIGYVIHWISLQSWCDGRVATAGTSYSAITTIYSLTSLQPALKGGVCRAPDFDMYRHLFAPGGIENRWFIETWGAVTTAQDSHDTNALYSVGYWPEPECGKQAVVGVRSVRGSSEKLAAALLDHKNNFNIASSTELSFLDDFLTDKNPPLYSAEHKAAIEAAQVPLIIRCGWHDAGTALGALSLFTTIDAPVRVILGPWNHEGSFIVDPFQDVDSVDSLLAPVNESKEMLIHSLDSIFSQEPRVDQCSSQSDLRIIEYFTLGENAWKTSKVWPLEETKMHRWYFNESNHLSKSSPVKPVGRDQYYVDTLATTGKYNRWHAQSPAQPVLFPDRKDNDKRLIVYDTDTIEQDMEITGHPVVCLYCSCNQQDFQCFVYLETIDPDGRVTLLTEGQLRGIHHKVSGDTPPYRMFGPYHSLLREDSSYISPNQIVMMSFDLLPLSVLIRKGHRLRVALAGVDYETFMPLPDCETQILTVERNQTFASFIDIPVIPFSR